MAARRLRAAMLGSFAGLMSVVIASLWAPQLEEAWAVVSTPGAPADQVLADGVQLVAGVGGALAWLWLLACLTACVSDGLRGDGDIAAELARGRLLRPKLLRLLVAGALGSGALATPAAQADEHTDPHLTELVVGLQVPERSTDSITRLTGVDPRPEHLPTGRVRVTSGDSLWRIADDLLPDDASGAEVTGAWHDLYRRNRARIGPDPGLIRPGIVLVLPTSLTPGDPR